MAKRWYVLHVFSGSEKKVAQLITEQAESNGLDHQIEEVMVPTEMSSRCAAVSVLKVNASFSLAISW